MFSCNKVARLTDRAPGVYRAGAPIRRAEAM
jgi:hypothetical protein